MENKKKVLAVGNKFLSFLLLQEEYCIEIERVKEIMGMPEITPLPQTPEYIHGVFNLRGKIIPVIDLKQRFELGQSQYTDRSCVIVIEIMFNDAEMLMGLIVDETREVIAIPDEKISGLIYINSRIKSQYIRGIADMDEQIKIILDIAKVFSEEEFTLFGSLEKEGELE